MDRLKRRIHTKPVQWGILILWLITVSAVFIPHFWAHIPRFVSKENIVRCTSVKAIHRIQVTHKGFQPQKLTANICDQIIFTNAGTKIQRPAFGPHPIHLIYPGYKEKILKPDHSNTFILSAYGDYEMHDHFNDELTLGLRINPGDAPGQN